MAWATLEMVETLAREIEFCQAYIRNGWVYGFYLGASPEKIASLLGLPVVEAECMSCGVKAPVFVDKRLCEKCWRTQRHDIALKAGRIRAARIALAEGEYTEDQWIALLEFCGGRCLRCGTRENISRDHVVPIANGGSNSIANLQPLCCSCNSSKGTKEYDLRDNRCKEFALLLERDSIPDSYPE